MIEAPKGLNEGAKAFWNSITTEFDIPTETLVVLKSICKTLTLIDRLEDRIDYDDLTYETTQGAKGMNPLVVEVRMQRTLLNTLLKNFTLTAEDTSTAEQRSAMARDMANRRWKAAA